MSRERSTKHLEILEYVMEFYGINFYPPSIRDISQVFHISTSVVTFYLGRLEKEGLIIERPFATSRGIVPVEIFNILSKGLKRSANAH